MQENLEFNAKGRVSKFAVSVFSLFAIFSFILNFYYFSFAFVFGAIFFVLYVPNEQVLINAKDRTIKISIKSIFGRSLRQIDLSKIKSAHAYSRLIGSVGSDIAYHNYIGLIDENNKFIDIFNNIFFEIKIEKLEAIALQISLLSGDFFEQSNERHADN